MSEIEIYVHIPFCVKKCSYCDFISFHLNEKEQNSYVESLLKEIELKRAFSQNEIVRSVYIGGGTPTCINALQIKKIIARLKSSFNISSKAEITIEANPGTLSRKNLDEYLDSGINRISIGCQSINDYHLKFLGRIHNFEIFINSYDLCISSGFRNINIDMIYGIPHQKIVDWMKDIDYISSLDIQHISIYCLTLEKGTPLYNLRNSFEMPQDDIVAKMYESAVKILSDKGLKRYEISNFAKEGFKSIHNLGYWSDVPYLGFGISASSYFNNARWKNTDDIIAYNNFFKKNKKINKFSDLNEINKDFYHRTDREKYSEFIFLGLRMSNGISKYDFFKKFGLDIFDVYKKELEKHFSYGTLIMENGRIIIPDKYFFVSNSILCDFI